MNKLAAYALVMSASIGTSAMLGNLKRATSPDASAESRLAANGAFRDGMYLGKLAAENGRLPLPAVGRWSTEQGPRRVHRRL
jgi:hypothetical protein